MTNPDLFVCGCRTWICLDITRFYEELRQPCSWSAWPACPPKNGKSSGFNTICTTVCNCCDRSTAVGCVIWRHATLVLLPLPFPCLERPEAPFLQDEVVLFSWAGAGQRMSFHSSGTSSLICPSTPLPQAP